jgi:hypothetical protein
MQVKYVQNKPETTWIGQPLAQNKLSAILSMAKLATT